MNRRMIKKYLIILAALVLAAAVPGCGQAKDTDTASNDQAPAYAAAITETMLQALNDGDYQSYRLAFTKEMNERTTEKVFTDYRSFIQSRIGAYKSKKFSDVKIEGNETTVIYKAKYSKEPADVTVTIIFQVTDDNIAVSDFWLNSPKLWED
jgi:hypothetical protein